MCRALHTTCAACGLRGDERGAVSVEYIVIIGLVALSTASAIVFLGPALVTGFETARNLIVAPFP